MSKSAVRDYELSNNVQHIGGANNALVSTEPIAAATTWCADAHATLFSPSHNIELHDMRHVCAGWSLRIKRPTTPNETLVRIPWDHILDSDKACTFLRALRSALLLDATRPTDPALEAFLINEGRTAPEFVLAAALLAAKQLHLNPSPVLDGLPPMSVDGDILRTFVNNFHWMHEVIEACGDLGIPLTWEATLGPHAKLLHCDAVLHARVTEDAQSLMSRRVALDGVWTAGGLPRTLLPDDASNLFGSNAELTRYVAWIRSRWICFLTKPTDDSKVNKAGRKDKKARASANQGAVAAPQPRQQFAVCPLIEKLNHHPNSAICPTVEAGEYVAILSEAHASSPNQLSQTGDELFISYGALPNVCLLERYGFLMTPLAANDADVVEVPLPLASTATLERWCIAEDAVVKRWVYRPNAASHSGATTIPPVAVLFAVAVASLEKLEASGCMVAPTVAAASKQCIDDAGDDGNNTVGSCFGEVSDGDDDASTSWFYDEDRMLRFLTKHQDVVMEVVLDALEQCVLAHILEPARQAIFTMTNWVAEAPTKELREQLLYNSNSRYWATRYAEQREAVGTRLLGQVARMRQHYRTERNAPRTGCDGDVAAPMVSTAPTAMSW